MSFELAEEQLAIGEMAAGSFAGEKLAPFAEKRGAEKTVKVESLREAMSLGFGGMTVRESAGGTLEDK